MKTEIGKIEFIKIGTGGYDDGMFGVSFTLSGKGWGCGDFWGFWSNEPGSRSQWTKEDQIKAFGEHFSKLKDLMFAAKVSDAMKLKGIPIEAIFNNNGLLYSWRILEEVL